MLSSRPPPRYISDATSIIDSRAAAPVRMPSTGSASSWKVMPASVMSGAWVIVLLWASKADTYGPFPNANMIGAMGLAGSTDLRSLLYTGWLVLIPSCALYTILLAVLT